jgi:hypothetical protein
MAGSEDVQVIQQSYSNVTISKQRFGRFTQFAIEQVQSE